MIKLKFSMLFIFVFTAFLVYSCRKFDTSHINPSDEAVSKKFLTLPSSAKPEIKRVVERLELLNQKASFLTTIAKQDGFPVWGKSVIRNINSNNKNSVTSTGDTIIYIPLVIENDNYVNAFIFARLNGEIHLQLHQKNEYKDHGFGTLQDSSSNAE